MKNYFFILLLLSAVHAFSIVSYENDARVLANGDLNVYEKMVFDLEQEYNEGYRSIRPDDFDSLSDISVHSVKVNGNPVRYETVMNGQYAEIIWLKTYVGQNIVELNYTIRDRVELYDDFAKICYEHYGANWAVPAQSFVSRMKLPEQTRGRTMHFEVYSTKKGEAHVDDLTIVIEMDSVPSGNYIGGCYLFFKGAVNTTKTVSGSAYELLQEEREFYGSETILEPESDPSLCMAILFIIFLVFLVPSLRVYNKNKKRIVYPPNILPPEKEEPGVVSVLVRQNLSMKDIMAATILGLISRGVIDIVELEKKGETSAKVKRERTILILKKKNAKLKNYEKTIIDMLFEKGDEVDLDAMAREFEKVKTKKEAKELKVVKGLNRFNDEIEKVLKDGKVYDLKDNMKSKTGIVVGVFFFAFILICALSFLILEVATILLADENFLGFLLFITCLIGIAGFEIFLFSDYLKPTAPKNMEDKLAKWIAFVRAIKASRLKEYPPASAVIWDDIIVYATALGLTDKVKKHLYELKSFNLEKIERMERVTSSTYFYYTSAVAVSNLSKYGRRSGPRSSGGFSSASSGGWSSGGGGGFSGGSSGGGGFR